MIIFEVYLVDHFQRLEKPIPCLLHVPANVYVPWYGDCDLEYYPNDKAADPHIALIALDAQVSVFVLFVLLIHLYNDVKARSKV